MATETELTADRHATFSLAVTMRDPDGLPYDLSGIGNSARFEVRASPESASALLTLTSAPDGGVVLSDGAGGTPNITITVLDLDLEPTTMVYGLLVVLASGERYRILRGPFCVRDGVPSDA